MNNIKNQLSGGFGAVPATARDYKVQCRCIKMKDFYLLEKAMGVCIFVFELVEKMVQTCC